jgi:hypothetical protein
MCFLIEDNFSFLQDYFFVVVIEKINIIMSDTVETEKNHAGFIAVHVGRFSENTMNMNI